MNQTRALLRSGARAPRVFVVVVGGVVALALGACAPETTLTAYDMFVTPFSSCTFRATAPPTCADEATLRATLGRVRWVVDDRDDQSFLVTTDDGSSIAGMRLPNDGASLSAPGCGGEGGTCLFARRMTTTIEPESQCQVFAIRAIFVHTTDDGRTLRGEAFEQAGTGNTQTQPCATSTATEVRAELIGFREDEPALAAVQP
jgi:hypothetical protein